MASDPVCSPQVAVTVPVDGGEPAAQCLVAHGQAAAREYKRWNRHLVQLVEQFAQQVVLAV